MSLTLPHPPSHPTSTSNNLVNWCEEEWSGGWREGRDQRGEAEEEEKEGWKEGRDLKGKVEGKRRKDEH